MKDALSQINTTALGFGFLAVLCVASVPILVGEKIQKKIDTMFN